MAQLNPNFEIDFNDINSYEQIQLINDTRLAKENLLMHKAYKEPADDAIIRNQFSSFTFVDFCPKLFTSPTAPSGPAEPSGGSRPSSSLLRHRYELETFSDLFERINRWLRANRDWRVISMETLVFDCTSQFNQVKSSIYSRHLPRNMRGLRLFLSPAKSRFSGAQKIGCINVVPRKIAGNYLRPSEEPPQYENLDEILARLNELLLTRPIEGRILSVETITLPIVNGYVNTETNYFMDSRLNALEQSIYNVTAAQASGQSSRSPSSTPPLARPSALEQRPQQQQHALIDILRVYYEFGPMVCGLVNLIDFVPRFHQASSSTLGPASQEQSDEPSDRAACARQQIGSTESLTRLIRRSLAWFEAERKRVLGTNGEAAEGAECSGEDTKTGAKVDLKVCNLQVHQKVVLKRQLLQMRPDCALDVLQTRQMYHDARGAGPAGEPVDEATHCSQCAGAPGDICAHLAELAEPYEVKFVRLAYVVPVHGAGLLERHSRPVDLRQPGVSPTKSGSSASDTDDSQSSSSSDSSEEEDEEDEEEGEAKSQAELGEEAPVEASEEQEPQALQLVRDTNQRHRADELSHQLAQFGDPPTGLAAGPSAPLNDGPIGQLTYRLFAPCQLVNSSSCFAINPVNSSSPLARRGSVDLNGAGQSGAGPSSDGAQAAAMGSLLAGSRQQLMNCHELAQHPQQTISFGAFFPALTHDRQSSELSQGLLAGSAAAAAAAAPAALLPQPGPSSPASKFTTNEFESVEAIRRRMEIYVTTNPMKVLAGETIVVNLSDALSCLSTAIEQTVARAAFASSRAPSTWVSVYILYAAVGEPQVQLLESQRRHDKLASISEEQQVSPQEPAAQAQSRAQSQSPQQQRQCAENLVPMFDDDFKTGFEDKSAPEAQADDAQQDETDQAESAERREADSWSLHSYNRAYERTVALPSSPDALLEGSSVDAGCGDYLEPMKSRDLIDLLATDNQQHLWLDENDLIEAQSAGGLELSEERYRRLRRRLLRRAAGKSAEGHNKKKRSHASGRKRHDSQCSII